MYQNISVCDAIRKCEKESVLVKQLSCTVCGGEILHNRVEDSRTISRVYGSGAIVDLGVKTNGYDEFVCANNSEHMLSEEMHEMLIKLAETPRPLGRGCKALAQTANNRT